MASVLDTQQEDDLAVAEEHCTKLSRIVTTLKKQNADLKERIRVLEQELVSLKSEMGASMYKNRESITDLISTVKVLHDTISSTSEKEKKTVVHDKKKKQLNPSRKLAEGLVDGTGVHTLIPAKCSLIEEV